MDLSKLPSFGIKISCLILLCQSTQSAIVENDWHPLLASEHICQGEYIEPNYPFVDTPLADMPIKISANQGAYQFSETSHLKGDVLIQQGNRSVRAQEATLSFAANGQISNVTLKNNIIFQQPGLRFITDQANFFPLENKITLTDTHMRLYTRHARSHADEICFQDPIITLKNASYTTCPPFREDWLLKSKQTVLDRTNGRGQAYHATLYYHKLPIFYTPYIDFPLDKRRKTGFLFPRVESTNHSGIGLSIPFYWNLAPNYDATLTPKIYSKRGTQLNLQTRYLTQHNSGQLFFSILPSDKVYRNFKFDQLQNIGSFSNRDPRVIALRRDGEHRYYVAFHHHFYALKKYSFDIDYHYVGDDNYFYDLGHGLTQSSKNQLKQLIQFKTNQPYFDFTIKTLRYQILHPFLSKPQAELYRRMPEFNLSVKEIPLKEDLILKINANWTYFDHKRDPHLGLFPVLGHRFHTRGQLYWQYDTPGFSFRPRVQFDYVTYDLSQNQRSLGAHSLHPSRGIPLYDLKTKWTFSRYVSVFSHLIEQTLEPILYFLYVPYRDQNALPNFDTKISSFNYFQLFRDDRYVGIDRVGDTTQLTYGLTSRWLESKGAEQYFRFNIGQIIYFNDQRVTLCQSNTHPDCLQLENPQHDYRFSDLVANFELNLSARWKAFGGIQWRVMQSSPNKHYLFAKYQPSSSTVMNLGYQYARYEPAFSYNSIHLLDINGALEVTPKWRLVSKFQYDLWQNRSQQLWAGIEKNDCCTGFRVLLIRSLKPSNPRGNSQYQTGIFFSFLFKGLGDIGNNQIDKLLTKGIPGYQTKI